MEKEGTMGPGRLERPTYCLEGSCSIQLSYDPWHRIRNSIEQNARQAPIFDDFD